jgi:hypothetical protein
MQNLQNITSIDTLPFLLIVTGAVFVHICFQLSVSVLTLLSSHTIGRRLSNQRLLSLNFWYVLGVGIAVMLLQLSIMAFERFIMDHNEVAAVILTFTVVPLIALLTVFFYYRRGNGTRLWLPRAAAEFITSRAKKTHSSVEAFSLGVTTAFTELPFALAPLTIVAYSASVFTSDRWFTLSLIYALAVITPLIFVAFYLSSGHKVSSVQRWRESAKNYLRWTSAITLMLLVIYIAVLQLGATS